jgi:hypothetical protein
MKRLKPLQRTLAVASVTCLLCFTIAQAKKPDNPGGGGGGGGKDDPFIPAWVVIDEGQLILMSSNGVDTQKIGKGQEFRRLKAPAWSPDGNWIAYIKAPNILMVRPDGSDNQLLAEFTTDDDRLPTSIYGLQWVPGEVDRIIYRGRDADIYTLSTVTPGPPHPLGLSCSGATFSTDLDPEIPGYQGAIAYRGWNSGNIVVVHAEDGEFGLELDFQAAVEVSSLPKNQHYPAWSNDGSELVFVYGDREDWLLEVLPVLVTLDSITLYEGEIRTLAYNDFAQGIDRPRWAPDDSSIAYTAQVGGEPSGESAVNLFRVHSDGLSQPVNVTDGAGRQTYVDWDPLWVNDID